MPVSTAAGTEDYWLPLRILACIDSDEAGMGAAAQLMAILGAVRSVQVPMGKDMNEFYLRAGEDGCGTG